MNESSRPRPSSSTRMRGGGGFLVPLVVVFAATTLYPVGYALYNSLFEWNWGAKRTFVGLDNYTTLLSSSEFWAAAGKTIYFAATAVAVETVIGLALAVVLNTLGPRARGVVRGALLLPLMVSGIVVATVWKIMLDPTFGILPHVFGGISPTDAYLGDPVFAMPLIVGIDTWWQTGFAFIILTAALDSLPREPFEAAAVDGAGAWRRFWHVTLPMLRPWVLLVVAIRLVETLKVFDIIFGTTGGGPQRATESLQVTTYLTGFKAMRMSEAMTLMIIFLVIVVGGLIGFTALRRRFSNVR